jgi:hypothetical protein
MSLSFILSLAMAIGHPYTGPHPDDQFWTELASRAGLQPLRVNRSLRLMRVAWALFPGTIVTVVPVAEGAQVEIKVLPNWQERGASVRMLKLSPDRFQILSNVAATGFWAEQPVAPTGKPNFTDGVVWYIEGLREGEKHSIVRHEPNEARIRAVCAEFMSIIGEPELAPHP